MGGKILVYGVVERIGQIRFGWCLKEIWIDFVAFEKSKINRKRWIRKWVQWFVVVNGTKILKSNLRIEWKP